MRKSRAISILQKEIEIVSKRETRFDNNWATHIRQLVKNLCGPDSDYYKLLCDTKIAVYEDVQRGRPSITVSPSIEESSIDKTREILESCLVHINNFGVYSPPDKNFLSSWPQHRVIWSTGALILASFISGFSASQILLESPLFTNLKPKPKTEESKSEHNEKQLDDSPIDVEIHN